MLRQQSKSPNTSRPTSPQPARSAWLGRLFFIAVLALAGVVVWQRQAVSDWVHLYGYQPPARVSSLASQTTMTSDAKHLFYLNKPLIATKTDFSNHCKNLEKTIVLGCYHGGQAGIFILEIADNSELHGVMQVTAAHEMLHAAYDRLSASDKVRVDKLLQQYYDHGLHDQAIKDEVDAYRSNEPGELLNEMHSIFGTEVKTLPAELEQYYGRYFSNRQAVVAQAERYQEAFRSREAAVERYDAQLERLQKQITANEATLRTRATELQRLRAQLSAYRDAGKVSQYNAAVPHYNSLVRSYNSLLETTRAEIEQFNAIVKKRNALVVEEQQLVKQLSGSELPSVQ